MHNHRGTLRLLITIVTLVVLGIVVYLLITYAMARATASVPKPVQPSATSTLPIATSSPISTTTTPSIVGTSTPTTVGGTVTVSEANNNGTVTLTKGEHFDIALGSGLNWTLIFNPVGILSYVAGTTSSSTQGEYVADAVGTTIMHATGAPICKPDQACPMFLAVSSITFVVKP